MHFRDKIRSAARIIGFVDISTDARSVLWLYAPGIVTDGALDVRNCEKLAGIPYGTQGLRKAEMPGFTSYYLQNYEELTPAVLKEIASYAGVVLNVK